MNSSDSSVLFRNAIVLFVLSLVFSCAPVYGQPFAGGRVLDAKLYHLGDDIIDLWPGISEKPEGDRLTVKFSGTKNDKEFIFTVEYWDLNYPAAVELNGKPLSSLAVSQKKKHATISIPAGILNSGQNTLTIVPQAKDDCVIGNIVLHEKSYRELMKLKTVTLSVRQKNSRTLLPARITITDTKGAYREIYLAPTNRTAIRQGLIYIPAAETKIDLVEGDYIITATRGTEWSLDKKNISLREDTRLQFTLRREVDTKGFVAADTHIHTLTFSGHGDASVEERVMTIAGEGVELAIATDHHHHTDYKPYQEKLGLNQYYTSVTGNEVSTRVGHFNTFPMVPNGPVPNKEETNWVKLVQDMRDHGGKVVILNHPRWARMDAFDANGLNTLTGERASGVPITFDAMELVNSAAMLPDKERLLHDWFALLNYGEKITAVGASDSHHVAVVVGQSRTYIRSSTDVPSRIDVEKACETFLAGDSSVSYGIFADVVVNNRFRMGQLSPVSKTSPLKVKLRVAAPSWVRPDQAVIYLNGSAVKRIPLNPKPGKPFDETFSVSVDAPIHDAYLVCAIFGTGVSDPAWPTKEPYTFAATNPVFLDADNNGRYSSPRETAQSLLAGTGNNFQAQWKLAERIDDAIAVQLLDLAYKSSSPSVREQILANLSRSDREVFRKLHSSYKPEVKPLSAK